MNEMAIIKCKKRKNGMYYFELILPNKQILCRSEDYSSVAGLMNGCALLMKYAPYAFIEGAIKDYPINTK